MEQINAERCMAFAAGGMESSRKRWMASRRRIEKMQPSVDSILRTAQITYTPCVITYQSFGLDQKRSTRKGTRLKVRAENEGVTGNSALSAFVDRCGRCPTKPSCS
ncbi:MAG: hypothetical protein IKK30_04650 [Clostridia bacterium]|nr:hypothetical protein [Clostridia bacterium]